MQKKVSKNISNSTSQRIKISLIGDIFPGELSFTRNYGIRSQFEQHNGEPWINKIKGIIGENDLVIGNLESPLVEKENAIKDTFYGNPKFAAFLKKCGINVLNVANNHILEQGEYGFKRTLEVLSDNDLDIVGHVKNGCSSILYKEIRGIKIAIAGFSNVDLHKISNNSNFAVLDEENVLNTLNIMEQHSADIRILSLHWGNEYINFPSLEQRKMAYKFIDAGATIIAGHHPHVIQPYEKYKDGHIFYSLGNFMFDFIQSKKISVGLRVIIEMTNRKISNLECLGVDLSYKDLVKKSKEKKFNSFFSKINEKYRKLILNTDFKYKKVYKRDLACKHLLERIYMKTNFLDEFFRIDKKAKNTLIKNIKTYYLKK